MTTMTPQRAVMMNPSIPIHAQLQYQNIQSQSPAYHYRPQLRMPQPAPSPAPGEVGFDGKMLRKAMARKTVDYNSSVVRYLQDRIYLKSHICREHLQPDILYSPYLVPPQGMLDNPVNCVMTKFIRPATNKNRCPIFCVCWTPDGRRLITGASSGEFTLWNGLTFNFETILQAHESSVRTMIWSHNEQWMLTGDQNGFIKYWQSNMNNVKMFQVHKEPVRDLSFCPTDTKFASCSDDSSVRIFDFIRCKEEVALRGHGSEVKCVDWHPYRGIVVSGSKDSQQPIILWDPRSGKKLTTVRAHKNACTDLQWNRLNGNWLISASRDHLCKLFDVRNLGKEVQCFRGHKKEASAVAWHPIHEKLFASGGSDGGLYFWMVGSESELAGMDDAHDGMIWDLSWHPLGHMLVSGSNDHTTRFWTRNRPGDTSIEKAEDAAETPRFQVFASRKESTDYPGLGTDENVLNTIKQQKEEASKYESTMNEISNSLAAAAREEESRRRKATFAKPISRLFEKAWKSGDRHPGISSEQSPFPRDWSRRSMPSVSPMLRSPFQPIRPDVPVDLLPPHETPPWVSGRGEQSLRYLESNREVQSILESDQVFGAFRKRSPERHRSRFDERSASKSPVWRRDALLATPPTERHDWPWRSESRQSNRWQDGSKRPRMNDSDRRPRFDSTRRR